LLRPVGVINGFMIISGVVFSLALFCIWRLQETYGCALTNKGSGR